MKSTITQSIKILLFLLFSILSFSTEALAQSSTVTTDKLEYAPGQYVIVTGANWLPGETVKLTFEETPLIHAVEYLYATADLAGNINNSDYLIQVHDQGQEFKLTATGLTSGYQTETLFADAFVAGVAPVLIPLNFNIDGNLVSTNTVPPIVGDWLTGPNGAGVLTNAGVPINPLTTFHLTDLYNTNEDNFASGKVNDNPNILTWVTNPVGDKVDVNNALIHFSKDAFGQQWIMVGADHFSNKGTVYIDFEFLQNKLEITGTTSGGFISSGPDGGRTKDDFILTLLLTNGGSTAGFFISKWTEISPGVFDYVDQTLTLGTLNAVFASVNTADGTSVPFGAFGNITYEKNTFAEAAINLTKVLSAAIDPCKSFGIKTLFIKTKVSASSSATIADFIKPIQVTFALGVADAGPNQTKCSAGSSTDFQLAGVATPSPGDSVSSVKWTVVSGTATIINDTTLNAIATVSSSTATIRLTVKTLNGCESFKDVILTVTPTVPCAITPLSNDNVCPLSSNTYSAPDGMTSYAWSLSNANGATITSVTNSQNVTVAAGSDCNKSYTLLLTTTSNGCSSSCEKIVTVKDITAPTFTAPANLTIYTSATCT
ncbi:hypothetical protein, partial [Flavobacterium xinjiangense]